MTPRGLLAIALTLAASAARAQPVPAARLAVLVAEDRRAPTARDLTVIRNGARSTDPVTARIALRALGRLERPALISDLFAGLRHRLPETRAEAANAIGQAAQGWSTAVSDTGSGTPSAGRPRSVTGPLTPASVLSTLVARLDLEEEASVRAAICEAIGRIPYPSVDQVARAEAVLVGLSHRSGAVTDRLGVAKGLEVLVRLNRALRPPSRDAVQTARALFGMPDAQPSSDGGGHTDPSRDARVRRLALETLIVADAVADDVLARAGDDPDAQVRRLAMRAASAGGRDVARLDKGLHDEASMVRLEALRGIGVSRGDHACAAATAAASDADLHVALVALDQLVACGGSAEAVALLVAAVNDLSQAGVPRGWHRSAHALVAMAAAAPDRASAALGQFAGSTVWHLRVSAARAASILSDENVLKRLVTDPDDNVVEAAIEGLASVGGHSHDALYVAALARSGYQVLRAAAVALDGSPARDTVVPALRAALQRLVEEGRLNSQTARAAITASLTKLGAPRSKPVREQAEATVVTSDELRRLAAPRARITIRDVGVFELALFTSEAPLTVLRFARLAESGYYDKLTFHRVVANFVVQGGSPGANEYVGHESHMRDEVGLWPHVRGAVGISTRGRDTGDAQIFVNLVDNPRFDHEYTVFAQVLNGIDVIDRILEGDIIERIEIVP